ncbi:SixA phosphatase family protein [Tunturiibacter gelidoferens]|jgi:phosphohistidine phosphatase|uniref:Phosphohistidine phosphatase n=1 Tax=Tunturiibacter gelidiferens TaxID=3069689 RepID=A0A9X0U477_9BACT|nr:histidine phosphatase family protein [Edaphobacter lichenicola]MBB5328675.1 phosphohistidine phosphatase [Edaphobacter lichenicola]
MNLYILRHASAGLRRTNPLLDVKRPLDKEGKKHSLQLAYVLNALNIQFDLIISSPLKRSLQTAAMIGTETGYEAPIQQSEALAPSATVKDFQKLLREISSRENVLVVGHNPNLTTFLGSLLVPASSPEAKIRLRKGSIARVVLTRGPATLQALLDPRTVRALYATSTKSSRRKISRK